MPVASLRIPAAAGVIRAILELGVAGHRDLSAGRASGSHSLVVPVQTAGLADLDYLADLRRLHGSRLRTDPLQACC
jgi:hypothetical protein